MNAKVETKSVSVGDVVVLVRKFGDRPETVNVARLSKKWFWVVGADGKEVGGFDLNRNKRWSKEDFSHERAGATKYDPLKDARVYYLESLERLNLLADRFEAERKEKVAAREAELAKRREEEDRRLAETKAAYGGSLFGRVRAMDTMPDGVRIYHVTCVVRPELIERKKGWEIAIIKCKDVEDWAWTSKEERKVKMVESHLTYTNGNESSFPSCSGERHANDEEALWANLTYIYHHW